MPSFGKAGESVRQMEQQRKKKMLLIAWIVGVLLIVVIALLIFAPSLGLVKGGGGVLIFVLIAILVATLGPELLRPWIEKQRQSMMRARRGAVAEERIGDLLSQLGNDFIVVHDVPSRYGNVDHIVLSRENGIFLIETKSHRGRVTRSNDMLLINNHPAEKDFIAQSLQNLYWLRALIKERIGFEPYVHAVLVFTNAFVEMGAPIKGVQVINKKYLLETLRTPRRATARNQEIWEKRDTILAALTQTPPPPQEKESPCCPTCGQPMSLRVSQKGPNAGKAFWVCKDYPRCKTYLPQEDQAAQN